MLANLAYPLSARPKKKRERGDRKRTWSSESVMIDVAPFRDAFHESGMSLREVAIRMGWGPKATSQLAIALGMRGYAGDKAVRTHHSQKRIRPATAKKLCHALGRDPVDFGV